LVSKGSAAARSHSAASACDWLSTSAPSRLSVSARLPTSADTVAVDFARTTSLRSEEWSHGTCFCLVVSTTSLRTRFMTLLISAFGVALCLSRAVVNGLLRPAPSSATVVGLRREHDQRVDGALLRQPLAGRSVASFFGFSSCGA
jgi:hypothetical protein